MGQLLGLTANGMSAQTGPPTEAGLCKELPKEARQDRRDAYYLVTDEGKKALNRYLVAI